MWDRRVLEKMEDMVGLYSISIRWQGVVDGFEWACSGVYGLNADSLRGFLWDELIGVKSCLGCTMELLGDFNVICFPSKKLGGHCFS